MNAMYSNEFLAFCSEPSMVSFEFSASALLARPEAGVV